MILLVWFMILFIIIPRAVAAQKTDNVTNWSISVHKWWWPVCAMVSVVLRYHSQLIFAPPDDDQLCEQENIMWHSVVVRGARHYVW